MVDTLNNIIGKKFLLFFSFIIGCSFPIFNSHQDILTNYEILLRLNQGQIYYINFVLDSGIFASLILLILQKIFFIFSADTIFILASGLLNFTFSLIIYLLVNKEIQSKFLLNSTILVSSFTFLGGIGGYYQDHLSLTFGLLSFYLFINFKNKKYIPFIIAILFFISFNSKQTWCLAAFLPLFITIFFDYIKRELKFRFILFLFSSIIIIFIVFLFIIYFFFNLENYIFSSWLAPWEYRNNSDKKIITNLIGNFLMPYNINIFHSIEGLFTSNFTSNRASSIFIINVFIIYLSIANILLRLIKRKIYKLQIIEFYLLITTLFCISIAGRGFIHLFLYIPVLLLIIIDGARFNNYYKYLFYISFSILSFVLIFNEYKYLVNIGENKSIYKTNSKLLLVKYKWNWTDIEDLKEISKIIDNESYSYIDDELKPLILLNNKNIIGYNTQFGHILNVPRNKKLNEIWQIKYIEILKKYKPTFFINSINKNERVFRIIEKNKYDYKIDKINNYISEKYNKIMNYETVEVFKLKSKINE